MMWNDGGWGLWWGFHGVVPLVLIAVVVWAVVVLTRSSRGPAEPGAREDAALAVLRERYARGELTREQFESMRRDLEA